MRMTQNVVDNEKCFAKKDESGRGAYKIYPLKIERETDRELIKRVKER